MEKHNSRIMVYSSAYSSAGKTRGKNDRLINSVDNRQSQSCL